MMTLTLPDRNNLVAYFFHRRMVRVHAIFAVVGGNIVVIAINVRHLVEAGFFFSWGPATLTHVIGELSLPVAAIGGTAACIFIATAIRANRIASRIAAELARRGVDLRGVSPEAALTMARTAP